MVVATVEVVLVSVSFVVAVSVRATVDGAHAAAAVPIILLETVTADLFVADDVYRAKDWPFLPSSIVFCSYSASAIHRLSPYFLRFQWPFAVRQSRTFGFVFGGLSTLEMQVVSGPGRKCIVGVAGLRGHGLCSTC